jgi:hypothetical protein
VSSAKKLDAGIDITELLSGNEIYRFTTSHSYPKVIQEQKNKWRNELINEAVAVEQRRFDKVDKELRELNETMKNRKKKGRKQRKNDPKKRAELIKDLAEKKRDLEAAKAAVDLDKIEEEVAAKAIILMEHPKDQLDAGAEFASESGMRLQFATGELPQGQGTHHIHPPFTNKTPSAARGFNGDVGRLQGMLWGRNGKNTGWNRRLDHAFGTLGMPNLKREDEIYYYNDSCPLGDKEHSGIIIRY